MRKILLSAIGLLFCSVATVMAQTSPYQGVAPEDIVPGNDYYLYNVVFEKWLGDNDSNTNGSWTSHAEIGNRGRDIKFIAKDGGWQLDPKMGNNHSINADNLYMDTSAGVTVWTIAPIEGSVANAVQITSGTKSLAVNNSGNTDSGITSNNVWQIVSRDERLAVAVANATVATPVDVSWLVLGGTFPVADDHRNTTWKGEKGSNASGGDGFYHCNRVWEFWNITNRNIYQEIAVPNGIYEVGGRAIYVSSANDRVNAERYDDYVNGVQTTQGYIYANDQQTLMRNMYEYVTDARVNDRNTRDLGNGKWAFNGTNEYSTNMFEGKGQVEPFEVTVLDGMLRVGFKVENGTGGSWILVDNISLVYKGEPTVDISVYIEALQNLLAEAEAYYNQLVDGEVFTTDAMQYDFAEAYRNAQAAVESTDADEIIAATIALREAMAAAKELNTTNLVMLLNWLTQNDEEWIEEEFAAEIDNDFAGPLIDAYIAAQMAETMAEVNNTKNALTNVYKQAKACKSPMPAEWAEISQSVVGTDDNVAGLNGKYYAYNVGTGRWFCGGDDWGAHAAVGFPGIEFEVIPDTWNNGHYNGIITGLFNGNWGNSGKLANNGYCDTGGNAWKFWQKDAAQGIYTWTNNGNDQGVNESNGFGTRDMVGFNPDTYMRVDVHQAGDDNPYNQWVFVTHEQRLNSLQAATVENPVDATFMIKMPGFNQRERVEGTNQDGDTDETKERLYWECNHENYTYDNEIYVYRNIGAHRHIIADRGANHADFAVDIYGAQWNDAFSLKQTITGLPKGLYLVKVQGYNNGGTDENKAVLVANDKSVQLADVTSAPVMSWLSGGDYADTTWDAIEYFQMGQYWNEVYVDVAEDGLLTIGVESPMVTTGHVVLFDNFRLEYLGKDVSTNIATATTTTRTGATYNLAGQQVSDTYKGIVIKDGKKMMVK